MIRRLLILALWLAFAGLSGLIAVNSLGYLTHPAHMPFLLEKAEAARHVVWRYALSLHVSGGILCLAASLLQFSRRMLHRLPAMHRWLGRIYAAVVLFVVCPSGLVLALFARGGWAGVLGFSLLGVLTFWTTWRGVRAILKRNTRDHAIWMIRSFAMISTAVTFRLWFLGFQMTAWDYDTDYLAALWLSLAGNALAAECLVHRFFSNKPANSHEIPRHRPHLHSHRHAEFPTN